MKEVASKDRLRIPLVTLLQTFFILRQNPNWRFLLLLASISVHFYRVEVGELAPNIPMNGKWIQWPISAIHYTKQRHIQSPPRFASNNTALDVIRGVLTDLHAFQFTLL